MSKTLVILLAWFATAFVASAFAGPSNVKITGDIRLIGDGNGIVFPDGSRQNTATEQGPVGPQGAKGDKGDKGDVGAIGPQGPAGSYVRTVVVSPVGTDQENGSALLNALAGITDASSSNSYLIKIEPGNYDIGYDSINMKQYVDIEGSGENTTTIIGANGDISSYQGVINGANNAEIRWLKVTGTQSTGSVILMFNYQASPKITNVAFDGQGSLSNYGIVNYYGSAPIITNVTVNVSGTSESYGIFSYNGCAPTMKNINVSALNSTSNNYGIRNANSDGIIKDATITVTGTSNSSTYGIANSSVAPSLTNAIIKVTGGYNATGIQNASASPNIANTDILVSNASSNNYGITNNNSIATINNVNITVSGGAASVGIYNVSSSPVIKNSSISVNADFAVGIDNSNSSPTLNNVISSAKNGSVNYGMRNVSWSSQKIIQIENSIFIGSSNSLYSDSFTTVRIGSSKLSGGVVNTEGIYKCVNVHDDNYDLLSNLCQSIP